MALSNHLSEIIYENVTEEYGWGKYGDFKVLIRRRDGYINATKLCSDGEKLFKNWLRLEGSKALISELEGSHLSRPAMEVIQGGSNYDISGTYINPELIPHVASWISPPFAIKVSKIVNSYIVREYKEQLKVKNGEISDLKKTLGEIKAQNSILISKVTNLSDRVEVANENIIETLDNLGAISNQRVPVNRQPSSEREELLLFHAEGNTYKVVRAQKRSVATALRDQKKKYPFLRVLFRFESRPNAKELWNAIKKRLREESIEVEGNEFEHAGDEDYLLQLFKECNHEKFDLFLENRTKVKTTMAREVDLEENAEDEAAQAREFWGMKMDALKEVCRARNLRGWSKFKKAELVGFILAN